MQPRVGLRWWWEERLMSVKHPEKLPLFSLYFIFLLCHSIPVLFAHYSSRCDKWVASPVPATVLNHMHLSPQLRRLNNLLLHVQRARPPRTGRKLGFLLVSYPVCGWTFFGSVPQADGCSVLGRAWAETPGWGNVECRERSEVIRSLSKCQRLLDGWVQPRRWKRRSRREWNKEAVMGKA